MKKQLLFISGGETFKSYDDYLAWLKSPASDFALADPQAEPFTSWARNLPEELGDAWEVIAPSMPHKQNARYEEWAIWFEKHLRFVRDDVTVVGWSLGANFLAKYLAEHTLPVSVASLHLVAGCFGCPGGFDLPASLAQVHEQVPQIFVYHSTDDAVVPFTDAERYVEALPGAELVAFDDRGHFLQEAFPEVVENVIRKA